MIHEGHMCMTLRRLKKPWSNIITSSNRRLFRTGAATRAEFMSLVQEL